MFAAPTVAVAARGLPSAHIEPIVSVPPPAARQESAITPTSADNFGQITSAESVSQTAREMGAAPLVPLRQSSAAAPVFGQPVQLGAARQASTAAPASKSLDPTARTFSFRPEVPVSQASTALPVSAGGLDPPVRGFSFRPEVPVSQASTAVPVSAGSLDPPVRGLGFSREVPAREPPTVQAHTYASVLQQPAVSAQSFAANRETVGAFVIPPRISSMQTDRISGSLPDSPAHTRLPGFERLNEANQESLARTHQLWGMSEVPARRPTAESSFTTQSTSFGDSRGSASASTTHGQIGSAPAVSGYQTTSSVSLTTPVRPQTGASTTHYGQMSGSGHKTSASSLSVHGQMSGPDWVSGRRVESHHGCPSPCERLGCNSSCRISNERFDYPSTRAQLSSHP
jgi:hypothetical protein